MEKEGASGDSSAPHGPGQGADEEDHTIETSDAEIRAGELRAADPVAIAPITGGKQASLGEGDTPRGMVLSGRHRYRIMDCIGRGGMGTVYLAQVEYRTPKGTAATVEQERMPPQVAVKILPGTGGAPQAVSRAEIGVMKVLRHPNVVRLYDWSFEPSLSFAVMDYCKQGSLLDVLKTSGPLSVADLTRLSIDILEALVEAHGLGMLHLDVKPANVLIGDDGRFLLTDFGIAGSLFQDREQRVVGTPAFMSPEQARGEMSSLDIRADLFMLGATLRQAMTADFSVQRRPAITVVRERKTESFKRLIPGVPQEFAPLAKVIDWLTEFSPQERPGTAAEVLYRIRQLNLGAGSTTVDLACSDTGAPLSPELTDHIRENLTDPLLRDLLEMQGTFFELRLYQDGMTVCTEGEHSYDVYLLLDGAVDIFRGGKKVFQQQNEGAIIGEVSALVGSPRTAMLRACGETALAVFKGAELEQAARRMPALAVRIMKGLASIIAERERR